MNEQPSSGLPRGSDPENVGHVLINFKETGRQVWLQCIPRVLPRAAGTVQQEAQASSAGGTISPAYTEKKVI